MRWSGKPAKREGSKRTERATVAKHPHAERESMSTTPKTAPVQGGPRIPWSLHYEAWRAYCKKWGYGGQSAERLAQRGGFHADEMDEFVPGWLDRIETD